jgi:hypothetical protein
MYPPAQLPLLHTVMNSSRMEGHAAMSQTSAGWLYAAAVTKVSASESYANSFTCVDHSGRCHGLQTITVLLLGLAESNLQQPHLCFLDMQRHSRRIASIRHSAKRTSLSSRSSFVPTNQNEV